MLKKMKKTARNSKLMYKFKIDHISLNEICFKVKSN